MIEAVANLLKVLNSETEPGQISLAFCLSMIIGFTPVLSVHNLIVLFLALALRVNLSAFGLGWAFFSAVAYLLDPVFHIIGLKLLTAASLKAMWTSLYNTTWFRLDRLHNTVVMGSLVFSLVLFVPAFAVFNLIIRRYREHILAWVKKTQLLKAIQASKFYSVYQSVSGWRGGAA